MTGEMVGQEVLLIVENENVLYSVEIINISFSYTFASFYRFSISPAQKVK